MYRCQLYVPDAADQGAIMEMQKAGLPVANQADKGAINTGIQVIKKFLKMPGTIDAKLFLAKDHCVPLVREFNLYHFKTDAAGLVTDDPDTEHDHWIDALRYPMTLLFGASQIILGSGLTDQATNLTDNNGNFNRMPTPTEYALAQGIQMAPQEVDRSKLGKIGKPSELEDQNDDDDSNSGAGGFIWSV
jgi:hypothetical protein